MADIADIAAERIEKTIHAGLSLIPHYQGKSLTHCLECASEIPQARQTALPGVGLCVYCQQIREARNQ